MIPVEFPESNVIYAKDQPEYIPLPAHRTADGHVTSCWSLTWRERFRILWFGRIFWTQMTFNDKLQPVRPSLSLREALR